LTGAPQSVLVPHVMLPLRSLLSSRGVLSRVESCLHPSP
jgi:hypothetical protein